MDPPVPVDRMQGIEEQLPDDADTRIRVNWNKLTKRTEITNTSHEQSLERLAPRPTAKPMTANVDSMNRSFKILASFQRLPEKLQS